MTRKLAPLVALSLVLALAAPAAAWESKYVKDALDKGMKAAKEAKDLTGYGPRSDGFCLVGGFVEAGKELVWKARLKKNKSYLFVGCGDRDVEKVTLQALEGDNVVAKDKGDEEATACVYIEAEGDAECTLKLKVRKASEEGVHFTLLILLEGEAPLGKVKHLDRTVDQLNAAVAEIAGASEFELDKEKNTVCFAACALAKGVSMSFDRTYNKGRKYLVVGAADDKCDDLDLELKEKDEVVDEDEDDDATPVLAFEASKTAVARTKVTAESCKGSTFAVVAVLVAPK